MQRILVPLCLLASLGLAAPAVATDRHTTSSASTRDAVTPTTTPPSAPGRLAYTIGVFEQTDAQSSMYPHGVGTLALDGSDQRTLTDPKPDANTGYRGQDAAWAWSPDGAWIAISQDRLGTDSVAVIPRDGGDPQLIATDAIQPAWSPDCRHIAWISIASDGSRSIGIADVTSTESTFAVTDTRTLQVPEPALPIGPIKFSPEGGSLAFSNGDYYANDVRLYTMSTAGDDLRQVSREVSIEGGASYSPDGTSLVFTAVPVDAPNTPAAYLVDLDGANQRVLVPGKIVYGATWSPGGDWLAVQTNRQSDGVVRVDPDGHVLGALAPDLFATIGGVAFSPDGTSIYTVASLPGPWTPDLYSISIDSGVVKQLTFDHTVVPGSVQAIDPGAVLREFGDGAVETAVAGVTENFAAADALVLSPTEDYAASLAAAPLAARLGAPALVTDRASLDNRVLEAARELGVTSVVLVGNLSPDVAASLQSAGLNVKVVGASASPYSVGAAVARQLAPTQAFLVPLTADTQGWRLPLATAGFAAFKRQPLLYTSTGSVPRTTKRVIRTLGIRSVTIVGNDSAVSSRVLSQLTDLGVKVHRLRSSDPYAISARLAGRAVTAGAQLDQPVVASGADWGASVTTPALAAVLGQANLLVDGRVQAVNESAAVWLAQHDGAVRTITLVGGVGAIRPAVEVGLEQRLLK